MKALKYLFVALLALLMTGCYSTRQVSMASDYLAACNGLTKDEAISQFGEPARTYQENGAEVLVYEEYTGEQTVSNRKYMDLVFDAEGVCRGVRTNYTKPERYRDTMKTAWAVGGSIGGTALLAAITLPVVFLKVTPVSKKTASE